MSNEVEFVGAITSNLQVVGVATPDLKITGEIVPSLEVTGKITPALQVTGIITPSLQVIGKIDGSVAPDSAEVILEKLLSVDGAGSALDADYLRGKSPSDFSTAEQGAKADTALQKANIIAGSNVSVTYAGNNVTISANGSASGSDVSYTHDQMVSSATWTIQHNLGKYASVTVVDSIGTVVYGDISYSDENRIVVVFTAPFSGKAYLN